MKAGRRERWEREIREMTITLPMQLQTQHLHKRLVCVCVFKPYGIHSVTRVCKRLRGVTCCSRELSDSSRVGTSTGI